MSTFHSLGAHGQKGKIFGEIECPIPISVPEGKQKMTATTKYVIFESIIILIAICAMKKVNNGRTHTSTMQKPNSFCIVALKTDV